MLERLQQATWLPPYDDTLREVLTEIEELHDQATQWLQCAPSPPPCQQPLCRRLYPGVIDAHGWQGAHSRGRDRPGSSHVQRGGQQGGVRRSVCTVAWRCRAEQAVLFSPHVRCVGWYSLHALRGLSLTTLYLSQGAAAEKTTRVALGNRESDPTGAEKGICAIPAFGWALWHH